MTTRREFLQQLPFGQQLNPEVFPLLSALGSQLFGNMKATANSRITVKLREQGLLKPSEDPKRPGQFLPYDGRYRGDCYKSHDFFLRDLAQGEDGKNVESQVGHSWNSDFSHLAFRPLIKAIRFGAKDLIACQA